MEGNTNISWSANDRYLQNFANQFEICQMLFKKSRQNIAALPEVFDSLREVWRMEKAYFTNDKGELTDEGKKIDDVYLELKKRVDNYRVGRPDFRQRSFRQLYDRCDEFFTTLNIWAVRKNFFPKGTKERTIDDKLRAVEQK